MPSKKPDTAVYTEASVRTLADWTPGLVRSALMLADAGNLRLAADLCEALLGDDRVQGVLGTRVKGLLRLPLSFEGDGDKRRQSAAEKALDQDFWKAFPEEELAQLATWGILLGVGVGQLVWEQRGARILPRLKVWHPRWLRFDWIARDWRLQLADGTEVTITPGDGTWILYTPSGANRPWSLAAWRPSGIAWLVKRYAVQDWARYDEAHGSPTKTAIAPEGADHQTRKEVAADLAELGRDTTIALPHGYDFKFVEAVGRTWETFQASIGWADKAIAISLVGQNLSSDVVGGSFAAATVHNSVRQDLIQSDAEALSTTLREQALVWWAEYNLGNAELAPWPRWDTKPPEDRKARADVLVSLANAVAALLSQGVQVDLVTLAESYDLPLLSGEVKPMPQPQPGGLFGELKTGRPEAGARAADDDAAKERGAAARAYVQGVATSAKAKSRAALGLDVKDILDDVKAAEDAADLKARLKKRYAALDPAALAEVVKKAFLLAELAGRYAAIEAT